MMNQVILVFIFHIRKKNLPHLPPRGFSEGHPVVFCGDMLYYVTQSFLLASSIFGLD